MQWDSPLDRSLSHRPHYEITGILGKPNTAYEEWPDDEFGDDFQVPKASMLIPNSPLGSNPLKELVKKASLVRPSVPARRHASVIEPETRFLAILRNCHQKIEGEN